jgi:hypothetical protein
MLGSLRRVVVIAVSLVAGMVVALSAVSVGSAAQAGDHTTTHYVAGGMGPHS